MKPSPSSNSAALCDACAFVERETGVPLEAACARDAFASGVRLLLLYNVLAPPGALADRWSRSLPDPVSAMASGWMRIRALSGKWPKRRRAPRSAAGLCRRN